MRVEEIIIIVSKRVDFLNQQKVIAVSMGDLLLENDIEEKIIETKNTLTSLKTLLG